MYIKEINLKNFRSYEELHLSFDEGIQILYGDNGQGKTNLLESIYVGATSRSHLKAKDTEMIRFGKEESHICIYFQRDGQEYREDIHLKKTGTKGIAINRSPIKSVKEYLGFFPVVFFSPEDLQIVKEGPGERRRFLDGELVKFDKIYLDAYLNYKKALDERNQLLKNAGYGNHIDGVLDAWDEQLLKYGTEIIRIRREFIKEISGTVFDIHKELTEGKEELHIFYEPNVNENEFREKLSSEREHDKKYRQTSSGPQRDDMSFEITETEKNDGQKIDARIFGSQGQKRTAALSLKLSEIEIMKKKTGQKPVLLLDDVLSELDKKRQEDLIKKTKDVQTFITCTGLADIKEIIDRKATMFHVQEGTVKR